jgi:hypothetical protein
LELQPGGALVEAGGVKRTPKTVRAPKPQLITV